MLPLRARQLVARYYFPSVLVIGIYKHLPCAHVNHGFDGKHHARNEQHALSSTSKVRYLWLFMELQTHSMPAQVANHTVMVLIRVLRNGVSDVANKAIGLGCLCTNLQTFLCNAHQLFLFRCRFADDKHARGVCIVAVEYGCKVYINDVALFQHVFFLRYAVTNHLVDTCTNAFRKAFVIETSRYGTMTSAIVIAYLVYFQGVHACMYVLSHLV